MGLLHEPETRLVLLMAQRPETVKARLATEIAQVRSVVWSPAWGAIEPFVGVLGDDEIHMRVRHGYSNGFTRILSGSLQPTDSGSRLDLRFRTLWWIEAIMRAVWLGIGLPFGFYLVSLARSASPIDRAELLAAVLAPALTLGFLGAIEWIARRLGRRDEQTLRDAFQRWFPTP